MKICRTCSGEILNPSDKKNFCSKKCMQLACNERNKLRRIEAKSNKESKHCKTCGNTFIGARSDSLYCSKSCARKNRPKLPKSNKQVDILSRRWELLWRVNPDARDLMVKIERKMPLV